MASIVDRNSLMASIEAIVNDLIDKYGVGWEFYLKVDSEGNIRIRETSDRFIRN
jgi:hypothetical protein